MTLSIKKISCILFFLTLSFAANSQNSDSIKIYHSIGEGLREPNQVEFLEVINLTDLDSLELLTTFPNLKGLSLIDYHFGMAPESLSKLTELRELRFINDDFYTIPASYQNLVNLKKVEFIYDTHLNLESTFNFLSALPALEELRIEGLSAPVFSDQIQFPAQLKILSLRNNHLNVLPEGIATIKSLEILDIGNNEFMELPAFIKLMPNLSTIYLDQQPFLRFDYTFSLLKELPALTELHLEGNHLSREMVKSFTHESFFRVFLDEDHFARTHHYTPHINMNLPPMLGAPSGTFKIPFNRN